MTKKHFIALADHLKTSGVHFSPKQIEVLADFCRSQNSNFNYSRWFDYLAGQCGPSGGKRRAQS